MVTTMINTRRILTPLFLSSTLLAGCASTPEPKVVKVPVCDDACQKALRIKDITTALTEVKGKNGGIDPTIAAMILRIRAKEDPESKRIIDTGLAKQGLQVDDDKNAKCLVDEKENGTAVFLCPKL